MIDNPVYKGVLRFGDELSEPFEKLRIVDDITFDKCLEIVKGRACKPEALPEVPVRTDSRSLLTGMLYCAECGSRLCYNHNRRTKTLADGTEKTYERDLYRCYRKISSRNSCTGQSAYDMAPLNDAVEIQVRDYLEKLGKIPANELVEQACSRNADLLQVAYKQALSDFEKTQKQVNALETEAVKALTGESQLDLSVVNGMLLRLKAQLAEESKAVDEARAKLDQDKKNRKATEARIEQFLTWAECYDKADYERKHMIIAALIDRVEVGRGYEVSIHFKVMAEEILPGMKKTA